MIQEIIIWIIFSGALLYLGIHFFGKKKDKNCAKGCGGCSSASFDNISSREQQKSPFDPEHISHN